MLSTYSRGEKALLGTSLVFSAIAVTALVIFFTAYLRVDIGAHVVRIRLIGDIWTRTFVILVGEIAILPTVVLNLVAGWSYRSRQRAERSSAGR